MSSSWEIYTDGASKPVNPGGIGIYSFIVYQGGVSLFNEADIFGVGSAVSNNVAEYYAVLKACELIQQEQPNIVSVRFLSDSKMVVNQMNGIWAIRTGLYIKTARQLIPIIEELREKYKIEFKWISRNRNREADHLCNVMYGRYRKDKNLLQLGLEYSKNRRRNKRRRKKK